MDTGAAEVEETRWMCTRVSAGACHGWRAYSAWVVRCAREAADAGARADARTAAGTAALAGMVAGPSGGPAALSPAPAAAPVALALAVPLAYAAPVSPTPTASPPLTPSLSPPPLHEGPPASPSPHAPWDLDDLMDPSFPSSLSPSPPPGDASPDAHADV